MNVESQDRSNESRWGRRDATRVFACVMISLASRVCVRVPGSILVIVSILDYAFRSHVNLAFR